MALNGVRSTGDDQAWKTEAEKQIEKLRKQIEALRREVAYLRSTRGK